MTPDDGERTNLPRRSHRLLGEADIRDRFSGPVAAYVLAVRGELVARYGEVDTYRRFAVDLAGRYRRSTPAEIRKLARRRAEHFNNVAGPPWRTTEEVLRFVVPADREQQCRDSFAALYTAARGEPPPGPGAPEASATPLAPAAGGWTQVDELTLKNVQLYGQLGVAQQDLRTAEARAAGLERAHTALRIQLAGCRYELHRLRRDRDRRHPARGVAAVPSAVWEWGLPPVSGWGWAGDSDVDERFAGIAEQYTGTTPGPYAVQSWTDVATTAELPMIRAGLSVGAPPSVPPITGLCSPPCKICRNYAAAQHSPPHTFLGRHHGPDPDRDRIQ